MEDADSKPRKYIIALFCDGSAGEPDGINYSMSHVRESGIPVPLKLGEPAVY